MLREINFDAIFGLTRKDSSLSLGNLAAATSSAGQSSTRGARRWRPDLAASGGPIRHLVPANLWEPMANGRRPACLRLRVVAAPATVDLRFIATEEWLDLVEVAIGVRWPEPIEADDPEIRRFVHAARTRDGTSSPRLASGRTNCEQSNG